jgi:putative transposase
MPRRLFVPGLSVHVIQRGNNGTSIFHDDVDRRLFLYFLGQIAASTGVAFHGFVLMSTHWHGLLTPPTELALPAAMKSLGERYVRYFNRKYGRFGTLWGGKYRSPLVTDQHYWLTCLRYIEQNPVRARMVEGPGDYQWSSYAAHAFGKGPRWIVDHPVLHELGRTDSDRQRNYRRLCESPLSAAELAVQRHPPQLPVDELTADQPATLSTLSATIAHPTSAASSTDTTM